MANPTTKAKKRQKKRVKERELLKTRRFRFSVFADLTPLDTDETVKFFMEPNKWTSSSL